MDTIHSKDVIHIMKNTLNLVDPRLVDHGEKVAYLLYKMMEADGGFSTEEIEDACKIALLHDIGAYKTEEIDHMVEFETDLRCIWEHSIYGYLFLKHFSPLSKFADVVLFHHLEHCYFEEIACPNQRLAEMINVSDRMNVLLIEDRSKLVTSFFDAMRDRQFSNEALNLFWKAEKKYQVLDHLEKGTFRTEITDLFEGCHFNHGAKLAYLRMLAFSIDFRSEYTVTHTVNSVAISVELAERMGLSKEQRDKIYYGSLLHDIGKITTPLSILEKPGKLTPKETTIMRTHVQASAMILKDFIQEDILKIAIRHHEKLDGSGYPDGLNGLELSTEERIVAIADIISALRERRSYKDVFGKEKIIAILRKMVQQGLICGRVVNIVIENYDSIMESVDRRCEEVLKIYGNMRNEYIQLLDMVKQWQKIQ